MRFFRILLSIYISNLYLNKKQIYEKFYYIPKIVSLKEENSDGEKCHSFKIKYID
jgi:hypothetical protein